MALAREMYKDNSTDGKAFDMQHCYNVIETRDAWSSLADREQSREPGCSTSGTARPDGCKKSKQRSAQDEEFAAMFAAAQKRQQEILDCMLSITEEIYMRVDTEAMVEGSRRDFYEAKQSEISARLLARQSAALNAALAAQGEESDEEESDESEGDEDDESGGDSSGSGESEEEHGGEEGGEEETSGEVVTLDDEDEELR